MENVQLVAVSPQLSDNDLREMMRALYAIVSKTQQGFILTISGYDDDPREVWQIPQAVELCERLVLTGFIGILEVTTGIKEAARDENFADLGFGAFEVWLVATRQIRTGANDVDRPTMMKFLAALQTATDKCVDFCQEKISQPMQWRTVNGTLKRIDDRLV